jgi:acetyl-CoA acetyltransferase
MFDDAIALATFARTPETGSRGALSGVSAMAAGSAAVKAVIARARIDSALPTVARIGAMAAHAREPGLFTIAPAPAIARLQHRKLTRGVAALCIGGGKATAIAPDLA